jgi:ABC-2 type transport system permease protein
MNSSSIAMPESFDTPKAAPVPQSATRLFLWALRRELWEHPSTYIAPLAVSAVFLIALPSHLVHLRVHHGAISAANSGALRTDFENYFMFASGLMMLTTMLVGAFYSMDALYGERRDRSILFWKSMPVSDLTTVLAKASIPIVVLQLIAWVLTVSIWLIIIALGSVLWDGSGVTTVLLSRLPFFQVTILLLYHLVILHGLWHAPFYAWMLMVSSWARRAPFLWAVLPPVAVAAAEKVMFNTSHFADMLMAHVGGNMNSSSPERGLIGMLGHFDPATLFTTPALTGLAITALFLFAAARLRRYRGPI